MLHVSRQGGVIGIHLPKFRRYIVKWVCSLYNKYEKYTMEVGMGEQLEEKESKKIDELMEKLLDISKKSEK